MNVSLIEAKPIGMWYIHFYDNGNGIEFIEVSQKEYDAWGGVGDPIQIKGKYIGGGCLTKFDTPSGLLEDGYYYQDGTSQVVKISGKTDPLPTSVHVINGTLDTSQLDTI